MEDNLLDINLYASYIPSHSEHVRYFHYDTDGNLCQVSETKLQESPLCL